jgi:hypothetical protein
MREISSYGHGTVIRLMSLMMVLAFAFVAVAADAPANVAGTWNVDVSDGSRKTTQTIVLKQDGGTITGTFKGPRQSGTVDGTVDGKNIKFHVTARIPLDYTGTVDGDSMKGTMSGRGQQGDWTATRSK